MTFSPALVPGVLSGEITVSFRLWQRPKVRVGGRYRVRDGVIEIERIDSTTFGEITKLDLRRTGERDLEALRERAAHSGPIDDETHLYRVQFRVVR